MVKPDYTFVRDGRPLHEWLPELVSPDPRLRSLAGDAVSAMFYAVPSVHTDLDEIEGGPPTADTHAEAWRRAVRESVERPDFPRRPFFVAAAKQLTGAYAE